MSLKKIAEMTGVSVSTVSRVLNNKGYNCASDSVKAKIWEAAQKIHYVPNENARNLKKGVVDDQREKRHTLAVVLGRFDSLEEDPFFEALFRSVNQEIFARKCEVGNIFTAKELLERGIPKADGFIILGRSSDQLLTKLKAKTRNIIAIDRNPTFFEIDEVICDGKEAATIAMLYLLQKGHQKIAYIGDCSYETRFVGYCDTLIKNRIAIDYSNIYPTSQTRQKGYEAMKKLLERREVSAVLCANDVTAIGALAAYREYADKRYKIDIISIDDIQDASETSPSLTTVHVPERDMGKMGVKILLDRIERGHSEVMRVEFPGRLIQRESC